MTDVKLIEHRRHTANGRNPVRDCPYCEIERERLRKERKHGSHGKNQQHR